MDEQHIIRRKLSPYIVADLFDTVTSEDILKEGKDGWMHRGNQLTEDLVSALKKEAGLIQKTRLYPILLAELQWHAREKERSAATEHDLIAARTISYLADVLRSRLEKMRDL